MRSVVSTCANSIAFAMMNMSMIVVRPASTMTRLTSLCTRVAGKYTNDCANPPAKVANGATSGTLLVTVERSRRTHAGRQAERSLSGPMSR